MQNKIIVFFICVLLICCTNHENNVAGSSANSIISSQLQTLLRERDYFKLKTKLDQYIGGIATEDRLYYASFIYNAFNLNADAIKNIDSLLLNYKVPDSVKAAVTILKLDCFFKTFQYAKAAETDSILLRNDLHFLNREKIDDIKNHLLIYSALKNTPAQQLDIPADDTINWTKDRLGLIEIPVQCRSKKYSSVFDTRANISSISQTYASKLRLKMLDVSYEEGSGITGIRFKTGLAIADSLYIGKILIRNAVFQVMPDSILYIAPVRFSLNIIIGYPVIEQLKEIHLYRDGKIIIPLHQSKDTLHNFALDELDPVISLRAGDDTLSFHLDLGATSTQLYAAYFNRYKSKILRANKKRTIQVGGAGGVQKKEVYVIPALDVYLGNRKATMDSVDVLTQKIYPGEKFYGNLGQDFVQNFNEFILNFGYMYIDAK